MKKKEFHNELTSIVKGLRNRLLGEEVSTQFLELQFKHGYLKGPKQFKQDLNLEAESYNGPILLNFSDKYKKIKVNADCASPFFENANANLQAFAKENECKVVEKYLLYINCKEERCFYDCSVNQWAHQKKFESSLNVTQCIRTNSTVQTVVAKRVKKGREIWSRQQDRMVGLHARFNLGLNILQSITLIPTIASKAISESQYLPIQEAIEKNTHLIDIIKGKLHEKEGKLKGQLELKFTTKGVQYLVQVKWVVASGSFLKHLIT